ncbi:hypothetical protein N186_08390 [Thermofilum adornatum]|uniref:DUF58 domain-containing protein n=2 Tax=Thermofilaceae TaxID=114378 RepID=S5ZN51_9CREN|nr:hypothetical protein N186_08390 [Thermofilum adornatum]
MELGVSKSRFLGIGIEYADRREYQDTDDVRYVDWTLTARSINPNTGEYKPYTKVFHVEQMKNLILVADLTDSMLIYEKIASLFYISSLILELSHRLSDKVSLVALAHKPRLYTGLKGRQAIHLLEQIICNSSQTGGNTPLSAVLSTVKAYAKKNTTLTVITDYAHDPEEFSMLAKLKNTLMTPTAIYLVAHMWETQLPATGTTATLLDPETGTLITGRLEEVYKAINTHITHVQAILSKARISHLEIQGIGDAQMRTVKIIETYLKARQLAINV